MGDGETFVKPVLYAGIVLIVGGLIVGLIGFLMMSGTSFLSCKNCNLTFHLSLVALFVLLGILIDGYKKFERKI